MFEGSQTQMLLEQLQGELKNIDPTLALNSQVIGMKYNPKLEIDRRNFEHLHQLGTGNFGCVYKGRNIVGHIL